MQDGTQVFMAAAKDVAGNLGPFVAISWQVDTTAPRDPAIDCTTGGSLMNVNNVLRTNQRQIECALNCTHDPWDSLKYEYYHPERPGQWQEVSAGGELLST